MARPSGRDVREEVLVAARTLIQRTGVDGFSYADIAKQLDIRAPSIHHHFASKSDLVDAVAERYRTEFADRVAAIEAGSVEDRLLAYARLFDAPASNGLLCLCGAIAAEWPSIADAPRRQVEEFFAEQLDWLALQLRGGVDGGEFSATADPESLAHLVLASLEGSMLMTRVGVQPDQAQTALATLIDSIRS